MSGIEMKGPDLLETTILFNQHLLDLQSRFRGAQLSKARAHPVWSERSLVFSKAYTIEEFTKFLQREVKT